jgi:hypothetical protein
MPGRPSGLLLTVKQTIPPVRPGAIRRDQLLGLLREANTRLVTVVAPAGWGKTSLLSDWAPFAAFAWTALVPLLLALVAFLVAVPVVRAPGRATPGAVRARTGPDRVVSR